MTEPAVIAIYKGTTSTRAIAFDLGAVGVVGAQRETTVVWECGSGRPVHPAIVWQERCLGRDQRRSTVTFHVGVYLMRHGGETAVRRGLSTSRGPSRGWRSRSRRRRWLRAFRCDSYEPRGLL